MVLRFFKMIFELAVIVTLCLYGLHKYLSRNYDYWYKRGIPHAKPIPLFGNFRETFTLKTSIGENICKLYNKFNSPIFGVYVGYQPYLVVKDPELVKQVLVKDFDNFADRNTLSNEKVDSLSAHMLFFSKNPEWRYMRNKVSPVFTSGQMKSMLYLLIDVSREMSTYLNQKDTNAVVEIKGICRKYAVSTITNYAFGLDTKIFERPNGPFETNAKMVFYPNFTNAVCQVAYFIAHDLAVFFNLPFINRKIAKFLREVFWKSVNDREQSGVVRHDVIDAIIGFKKEPYLNENFIFEGDKILAQAVQFFSAGSETMSSSMAFALYELSMHPNIQTRLRLEIEEQIAKHGGVNYESISNMSYLHMVVSETLRKYPASPFLNRKCLRDYKFPNTDFTISAGTPIFISVLGLHYDTRYWDNPEEFDPERFSIENSEKIVPCTNIPFGFGPRICIAERFALLACKVGLLEIIRKFEVEPCFNTPKKLKFSPKAFLLTSDSEITLSLKKINK